MRRALIAVGAALAAALVWTLLPSNDAEVPPATLTTEAGGVEITVALARLDTEGARFEVTLDTHNIDLDLDVADNATLLVGATTWGPARWDGDPAGGHHRQGQLTFPPRGAAGGAVRLTIGGLAPPAIFEWDPQQQP